MDHLFEDPKKLAEMMGRVPHFRNMPMHDLLDIVRAGSIVQKNHEDVIFREYEPCAGLYVLFKGQVHLYKNGPEGQEYILSVLDPVTMFNEVAVLDEGDNPATAIAQGDCTLWKVPCQDFRDLIKKRPQISIGLLTIIARRNRWLISKYEELCFLTVRARTAKLLLEFSRNGELEIDRRELRIQEIAARIFTSAEVVSRTISLLASRGVIDSSRQSITVRDAGALAELAYLDQNFEK